MLRRLPVLGALLSLGCDPNGPALTVSPILGIRDLVAEVVGPVDHVEWTGPGRTVVEGSRVPASWLWPGDMWEVTATFPDLTTHTEQVTIPEPPGGNVLVVLLDDVGVDKVSAYGDATAPATPTLDALADQGVRFTRAYANPVCTPTRASLLTGRHAGRTGMGWIADTGTRDRALSLDAFTLPKAMDHARSADRWADSAVGKWHVAGPRHPDVLTHPNDSGFAWFGGLVGNPRYMEGWGYDRWYYVENGRQTEREGYLTTATIDDALGRIDVMAEPWLLYLPLNAAHTPWTHPPEALLPAPLPAEPTDPELYDAVLQASDTELGRLLDTLPTGLLERTTIIVIGDNGTPSHAVDERYDSSRQKHTVYEGGVHVPLIVAGPHVRVPGSTSDALVHVTGVFATVAAIAGVPLDGPDHALSVDTEAGRRVIDGQSWLPYLDDPTTSGPRTVYTEAFSPNGTGARSGIDRRMVRDDRYKLMRLGDDERFFDLSGDHVDPDGPDLLGEDLSEEAEEAYDRLTRLLDAYEQEIEYDGF